MYELASRLHRAYVRRCGGGVARLPGRTVSVGNWTWGGAGKTPLCVWLAERLGKSRTGILTRGYRGGDEAALMRGRGLIVGEGRDRAESARQLARAHGPLATYVLDDGAQHWRVHRDVEVFSVDCVRFFGRNGWQIPFGTLRERPQSALARADAVVLHNANLVPQGDLDSFVAFCRKHSKPSIPVVFSMFQVTNTEELRIQTHKGWILFSGIGNNSNFFGQSEELSRALGKEILDRKGFMDHHVYSREDAKRLLELVSSTNKAGSVSYITTEKDLARCPWLAEAPLYARAVVGDAVLWGDDMPAFVCMLLRNPAAPWRISPDS